MNIYTLLRRYLQLYHCQTQKQCRETHGFYIRKDSDLWRLYCHPEWDYIEGRFDDFALFAYRQRFVVECPNHQWNIQNHGDWQYQLINIESEDNDE